LDESPGKRPLPVPHSELMREGEHLMSVCNACRYCEGYCAVFPAMERRVSFTEGDLNYLANLCHSCSDCYYACQYAPPHEFAINPAQTLARIRVHSYQKYAWPQPLAEAFASNGLVVSLVLALIVTVFLFGATFLLGSRTLLARVPGGDFYQITSHQLLATTFNIISLLVIVAIMIGLARFWRDSGEQLAELRHLRALKQAVKDVLTLKYLDSEGMGCTYPGEERSQARRWFHHCTFYGFMLCFAATSVGAFYHYVLRWKAPHGYTSLPVVLGTLGGIGLLIGPVGLYALKQRRNRVTTDESQYGMDVAFLALLALTSLTGLLVLVFRESAGMGALLIIHLGVVMTLLVTLPYGKFVHGVYRSAALIKYALERSRPQHGNGIESGRPGKLLPS
jgi:citrate/tricarballylate utilization protein